MDIEHSRLSEQPQSIEIIHLEDNLISEPENAYKILEARFRIERFSEEVPWMITTGLITCIALTFYRPETRTGLIAHILDANNVETLVDHLVEKFGGIHDAEVHLVMGRSQLPKNPHSAHIDGVLPAPQIEAFISEIQHHHPTVIRVDPGSERTKDNPRGIALHLGTGEVKEIDGAEGWSYSEKQIQSWGPLLRELEE